MNDEEGSFCIGLLLGMAVMFCVCFVTGLATHTWDEDIISHATSGQLLKLRNQKYKITCVEKLDWVETKEISDE